MRIRHLAKNLKIRADLFDRVLEDLFYALECELEKPRPLKIKLKGLGTLQLRRQKHRHFGERWKWLFIPSTTAHGLLKNRPAPVIRKKS